jgi:adenosine 3'-phospho 5'-phosphosulfate transporter B2
MDMAVGKPRQANRLIDLCLSFMALCVIYVAYGVFQEHIMTHEYPSGLIPSVGIIVLANRFVTVLCSFTVLIAGGKELFPSGAHWALFPGLSITLSSWCLYTSLRYVSYPTQVVFASSKILPTMLGNVVVNDGRFGSRDWMMAMLITLLVWYAGLNLEADSGKIEHGATITGYFVLVTYLLCDSFTSNAEKRILRENAAISKIHLLFIIGLLSLINVLFSLWVSGGLVPALQFAMDSREASFDIFRLSLVSTMGMFIIFHVISAHGPVVLSIMMTIRQVVSLVVSAYIFKHHISPSTVCIILVLFVVLFYNAITRLQRQHDNASKLPECLPAGKMLESAAPSSPNPDDIEKSGAAKDNHVDSERTPLLSNSRKQQ